jgi:C-terminal processing protease CtpA/Prc
MRKLLPYLPALLVCCSLSAQNNFGFEDFKPGTDTLSAWNISNGQKFGGGVFYIDGGEKHSGKYSLRIERTMPDSVRKFTVASIKVPVDFDGSSLNISCWLKTEDVKYYSSLWFRIDDANRKVLNNVNYPWNPNLKGATGWTQYSTKVELPETASVVYLGFLLVGEGKVWADDFSVNIDGKSLEKVAGTGRTIHKALSDSAEFSSGSKVSINSLTNLQVENLSLLGKVWGFSKYYYPSVASGYYNWDYELFRFLPSYLNVSSSRDRDALLLNWVNSLGPVPVCKKCKDDFKNVVLKPDLYWINATSDSLKQVLNFIRENRHQGKQYYMDLFPGVGNPNILHENAYAQFDLPDAGYRLLSLFRYWNIIQYWFPDKQLIEEDWKNVLTEFIPKFVNVKSQMDYWNVSQQFIARIHDTHANLAVSKPEWNNRHGQYYPPVMVTFVGNDPVVSVIVKDTLSALSNIQRGDVIKTISGRKVEDIIKERLPNLAASNYPTQLRDLALQLLRSKDSISTITIERDGKQMETKLHHFFPANYGRWYRYDFPYQADSSFFFIQPGVGYINLGKIKRKQIDSVFKVLEGSQGLIIDNRQYPGDFPLYEIVAKLNPESTPFAKFPTAELDYPGTFIVRRPISAGTKNKNYYRGKVIILVNENTQSSAEFNAMAFQTAPNSTVIGSTTAGADGNVTNFIYLPGGIFTRFSGIGVWYPDGRETQRVGIVPDIEVKRTVRGIKEGRDELVEKAIEIINEGQKKAF